LIIKLSLLPLRVNSVKLTNRGSLAAWPILTNAQDVLVILERGLSRR